MRIVKLLGECLVAIRADLLKAVIAMEGEGSAIRGAKEGAVFGQGVGVGTRPGEFPAAKGAMEDEAGDHDWWMVGEWMVDGANISSSLPAA